MHLGACVCTRIVFQYSIVSVFHPPLFSLPLALYLSSLAFFFFSCILRWIFMEITLSHKCCYYLPWSYREHQWYRRGKEKLIKLLLFFCCFISNFQLFIFYWKKSYSSSFYLWYVGVRVWPCGFLYRNASNGKSCSIDKKLDVRSECKNKCVHMFISTTIWWPQSYIFISNENFRNIYGKYIVDRGGEKG